MREAGSGSGCIASVHERQDMSVTAAAFLPLLPPPPSQSRPRDLATGLDLVVVVVRLSYVTLTTPNYSLGVQDTREECRY